MRCRACCRADVAGLWVLGLAAACVFGCENRMAVGLSCVLGQDYVLYRTWQSARSKVFVA